MCRLVSQQALFHPAAWAMAAVLLMSQPSIVPAQQPEAALNKVEAASKIAKIVDEVLGQLAPDVDRVFVREFRAPGGSTDVGLAKSIGDELASKFKRKYQIGLGAATEVRGDVSRNPSEEKEPLKGFKIRGELVLSDNRSWRFNVDVDNRDDAAATVAETGNVAPPADLPTDGPAVAAKPEPAPPSIQRGELLPATDSPFGVEVVVEVEPNVYQILKPKAVGDNTFTIPLKKGQIFAVRLKNRAAFDAACTVLIDGLSRFALADDPALAGGFDLVPATGDNLIKGYFRNNRIVDAFEVGEYSKSAVAKKLPASSSVGTITVTFAACWKPGDQPPPGEPPKAQAISAGPPRVSPVEIVQRDVGAVRSVVKIRYEIQ